MIKKDNLFEDCRRGYRDIPNLIRISSASIFHIESAVFLKYINCYHQTKFLLPTSVLIIDTACRMCLSVLNRHACMLYHRRTIGVQQLLPKVILRLYMEKACMGRNDVSFVSAGASRAMQ